MNSFWLYTSISSAQMRLIFMNFYGHLISCHDHLWSNEFAGPCSIMGFSFFFWPPIHLFTKIRVDLYRLLVEPLATSQCLDLIDNIYTTNENHFSCSDLSHFNCNLRGGHHNSALKWYNRKIYVRFPISCSAKKRSFFSA